MSGERLNFQADIRELLNLIIHAFYSNRDVFLREVISNASDAIEKQRINDLKNNRLDKKYEIRIKADKENKILTIEDDGIGMDRQELIEHLSTIARSGTKEFVKSLQEKSEQIGQFGVGFYSVFLVADRVQVITQKNGSILKWESDANEYYTIDAYNEEKIFPNEHGTRLILYLKEDALEYLEETALRRIISTHSSFITYNIQLWVTREVDVKEEEDEEPTEDEEGKVEEVEEKQPPKKEIITEWESINGDRPIWYTTPSEVKEEDYKTLYKTISKDYDEPLYWRHFQTEGAYEFRGIFFIPKKAPFDLMTDRSREKRKIRLYVKKVMVLDELEREMLPDWMNFVVGVIDSADLPLNVSREMLQQTKVLRVMKTQLKKQIMTMLNDLLRDADKYKAFYESFQRNIKLGVHEGDEDLLSFLRIHINNVTSEPISIQDYIDEHLKTEEQKSIYYTTGNEENPMLKLYLSKGYSVLIFNEAIDEFMLQRVTKFKDFELVNIIKEHTTPWEDKKDDAEEESIKTFCEHIKTNIDDDSLETVRPSKILTEASQEPGFLFSSKFGWTGNMEKIMSSQPLNDAKSMFWMKGKKILEINLNNPIIRSFKEEFEKDEKVDKEKLNLFFRCCLLSAGFPLENQSGFVQSVLNILSPVS